MDLFGPGTVLWELVGLAEDALTAAGTPIDREDLERPSRVGIAVGQIIWDTPCPGQLHAGVEREWRYLAWPNEAIGNEGPCMDGYIGLDVMVLLVRCIPGMDDSGNPPNADAANAAYDLILEESKIVMTTLAAGDYGDDWQRARLSQTWTALGDAVGVETRISLGLDIDAWCDPPEV